MNKNPKLLQKQDEEQMILSGNSAMTKILIKVSSVYFRIMNMRINGFIVRALKSWVRSLVFISSADKDGRSIKRLTS